jgi:hypothetical protein
VELNLKENVAVDLKVNVEVNLKENVEVANVAVVDNNDDFVHL